jgi:dephospho-CoA kinase
VTTIVCLAGGIASGKSTLAQAWQGHYPASVVLSFGTVVRQRAAARGRPLTREALQQTGLELIAEGWGAFVEELCRTAPAGHQDLIIVDGIRHPEAVEALRERFVQEPVLTVFLHLPSAATRARLEQRGEDPGSLSHEVESSVAVVQRMADLVLDASRPIHELAAAVVRLIEGDQS